VTSTVHAAARPVRPAPATPGARASDGVWALSRFVPQFHEAESVWLAEARQDAFAWVVEHGFPTKKDEDWKYTGLEPIRGIPFVPAAARATYPSSSTVMEAAADLGGPRLVFVNGHFAPDCSRSGALPDGITLSAASSWRAAGGERAQPLAPRATRPYDHAFTALNLALSNDGAILRLADGAIIDDPIELVFFSDGGGLPVMSNPRSTVVAGRDSSATIVETHVGAHGDQYWSNSVIAVVLEEGANVEHYKIQDEAESAFHLALLDVRQERNSRFASHALMLGSSIARHEVHVSLDGSGSEVCLDGLYLPRGVQHHDNPILIDHAQPGCTSRQLYKGIVDDHGHGVFNGHIVVRPGAFGTDATQTNKNLLLSDRAEVDTRPRLEIRADDVQCTHGAAVGRLDPDALFYLRSRGITEQAARGVLTYAFAREMVTRCRSEPIADRIEQLVSERLTAVAPEPVMANPGRGADCGREEGARP